MPVVAPVVVVVPYVLLLLEFAALLLVWVLVAFFVLRFFVRCHASVSSTMVSNLMHIAFVVSVPL